MHPITLTIHTKSIVRLNIHRAHTDTYANSLFTILIGMENKLIYLGVWQPHQVTLKDGDMCMTVFAYFKYFKRENKLNEMSEY